MNAFRIALANLPYPANCEDSVARAEKAVAEAANVGARIVCFPECYVPGYRALGKRVAAPDAAFLARAWQYVASAAGKAGIAVILGTERIVEKTLRILAFVVNSDGTIAGFQDKVQIDPSEESVYTAGAGRRVFTTDGVKFGIAICHEGWRYPETVRFAAQRGARIVFHPHFHEAEPGGYRPVRFADPANTFHEKAILCRAAENTCYVATVNCAGDGSQTTPAIVSPDGTLLCYQPYGEEGLLVANLDLDAATGLLASRCKAPYEMADEF